MRNYNQCESGLIYNEFSVILIQTFTSAGIEIPLNPETNFFIRMMTGILTTSCLPIRIKSSTVIV